MLSSLWQPQRVLGTGPHHSVHTGTYNFALEITHLGKTATTEMLHGTIRPSLDAVTTGSRNGILQLETRSSFPNIKLELMSKISLCQMTSLLQGAQCSQNLYK